MNSERLKNKEIRKSWVKYFIFNLIVFGVMFALQLFADVGVKAITESEYVIHQTNHKGDKDSYDAVKKDDTFYDLWYVQGTGVKMNDVVSITLKIPYRKINGVVVFEPGFTASGTKNYDSYKQNSYGVWSSAGEAGYGAPSYLGVAPGKVLDASSDLCMSTFATSAANSGELVANGGSFYSLLCIKEEINTDPATSATDPGTITIQYAYTIRNSGYGQKVLRFAMYYDEAYNYEGILNDPDSALLEEISFISSKPINENGFTWIGEPTGVGSSVVESCGQSSGNSGEGRPLTDNICIEYTNGTKGTEANLMKFTFPKETAYVHDVSIETVSDASGEKKVIGSIKDNSIFGTNSFINLGTENSNKVVYYYYNFILVDSVDFDAKTYSGSGNTHMNPTVEYVVVLSIDASGDYVFYIKDIFGNSFTTEKVDVDDVSKTNILVDYTNEVDLNIMVSTGAYLGGSWKQAWEFSITTPYTVDFKKVKLDEVTVEVYVFQKIVIANGEFAGNGTTGADSLDIEDIAKQPLGYLDGDPATVPNQFNADGVVIWRVEDVTTAGDTGAYSNKVTCATGEADLCEATNKTFSSGSYSGTGANQRQNKITFTVKSNGRYRIMITDNFGNTTDSLDHASGMKNPEVEVSVIDRTNPIISSALSSDTATSSTEINSYPYVIGGGEISPVNPTLANVTSTEYWKEPSNYTTIYYNHNGTKMFNYEDALNIAQIKVVDQVKYYYKDGTTANKVFDDYEVEFQYAKKTDCFNMAINSVEEVAEGSYCDPTLGVKSDRNTSGTATNVHNYIISNNITSFSAGLIRQVDQTEYDASHSYSQITGSTTGLTYVNDNNATTFVGYLEIEFRTSGGTKICTVRLDAENTAASEISNKACFNLMNQYIDDVENFQMAFTAQDYYYQSASATNGHNSNEYVVNVTVIDTTAPGIDMTGADANNRIQYTNEPTDCRLEIDNLIQVKELILKCYKLKNASDKYMFKDNNINHEDSVTTLLAGTQFYEKTGNDNYHEKIVLSILEEGSWMTITDSHGASFPRLFKSGYHQLKIEISDHWKDYSGLTGKVDNVLTIYVTYYVNPRTLLIEPLANDKMYGEEEPLFDYCVYVNKNNDTFNLEDHFFEKEFINEYFTYIYCTRNVFEKITTEKTYYKVPGTESKGYVYHTYTTDPTATGAIAGAQYLLINNTYVLIDSAKRYNMTYEANANGEYYLYNSVYTKIESGYLYKGGSCITAATDISEATNIRLGANCTSFDSANRYTKVYEPSSVGEYLKYNDNLVRESVGGKQYDNYSDFKNDFATGETILNANEALVNRNVFVGKLARVEGRCYNAFEENYHSNTKATNFSSFILCDDNSTASGKPVRNDNVGQYHMVLGTLSIKESTGTNFNDDYVIKINTNYISERFQIGAGTQDVIEKYNDILVDDGLKTESSVNFTIKQAVLTITANGSSKIFGEQDPYSNKWKDVVTKNNIVNTGYLGGYTVEGWRYNGNTQDTDFINSEDHYIISGTLRREVGEEVGIYDICNIGGNPREIDATNCLADVETPGEYDETHPYYFVGYDHYDTDGYSEIAALVIRTNGDIYVTDSSKTDVLEKYAGRTLNRDTRNYAISFVKNDFKIEANNLIIQPGVNQGKEYAGDPYNDPMWELVVYGEAINKNSGDWATNIDTITGEAFTGYTAVIDVEENRETRTRGSAPYIYKGSAESEVYYTRRKTSPDVTYTYVDYITLTGRKTYIKDGIYYYESGALPTNGNYIYAYGQYFEIVGANRYKDDGTQAADGSRLKITVLGRLVNQTYSLFDENFKLEKISGENVGWYSYVPITNYKETGTPSTISYYTIRKVNNSNTECVISSDAISTSDSGTVDCRNYTVRYVDNAPTPQVPDGTNLTGFETENGQNPVYKPDGLNACDSSFYSLSCGADNKKIKFEIFKREIILEFIDSNYTFIYGERYNYYDGGSYSGGNYTYNGNTNGIFYVNNSTSENDIFLCYSDLGDYLVDCTNNTDYGVTSGDTWTSIGLKFYLHNIVSSPTGEYYDASLNHKAVPAGTYFVYAQIGQLTGPNAATDNATILQNYKFTYRGGTLTIKSKVTNIQLTGYTMEYGESKYASYGLGSNYANYTSYKFDQCMTDASYLADALGNVNDALISDCSGGTYADNVVGNKYGFVVEGLDAQDSIMRNFTGRPVRAAKNVSNNGEFDDVGFYKIGTGSIQTVKDSAVTFTSCITNLDANGVVDADLADTCIFVDDTAAGTNTDGNARNYDITYSLANNEGAYLFILPAQIEITVYENQTKMYGCAYSLFKTAGSDYYAYTYKDGYTSCDARGEWKLDLAYKYNVTGDKDFKKAYDADTYDVTTNQTTGNREFIKGGSTISVTKSILTDDRLYRVEHNAAVTADYDYIKKNYTNYQGQRVGVYTISLGNLNIVDNSNAKCDAYNNPSLQGTMPCRNYNINYYGNSATEDITSHTYTDKKDYNLSDLTLYTLNYEESASGDYVFINGKYVLIEKEYRYNAAKEQADNGDYLLINNYVKYSTLVTYEKLSKYEYSTSCGSDCYIYLNDDDPEKASIENDNGYVKLSLLSGFRFTDSTGETPDPAGNYLKVQKGTSVKYIAVNSMITFAKNEDEYKAVDSGGSGEYVFINGEYVQLTSLKKYAYDTTTKLYSESASGEYIQVYEYAKISDLTKYKLDRNSDDMYRVINRADANVNNNLFVFINGSYVPYNDLISSAAQTQVTVNSARTGDGASGTSGDVTSKVEFVISARIVYVHPEYNVKPYGEADPVEYITCDEIKQAYGLTDFDGRSDYYCGASGTKVELGVAMYYAVQNSLAKSPWTEWTDDKEQYTDNGVQKDRQPRSAYNDIQYDVLTGKVSRLFDKDNTLVGDTGRTGDQAGKYMYDFADVKTQNDINGSNYMIKYVTNYDLEHTYVKTNVTDYAAEYKKLSDLLYETCANAGDDNCIATADGPKKIRNNEYKLPVTGTDVTNYVVTSAGVSTSVSLLQKYYGPNNVDKINYWYQGFYISDPAAGREGEFSKWWTTRDYFKTPYDTFKSNNEAVNASGEFFTDVTKDVYFEIIKRTIYLYAVDAEKIYGEADKYSDFKVAICPNAGGYEIDGDGNVKCADETAATNAHGLSVVDKAKFVSAAGIMDQWKIKNKGVAVDYIFQGTADEKESFGIYFRRANGENAGSYTITACAAQTGISDCTYEVKSARPNYTITHLGDNYEIIEIPGVLTIKTRDVAITPDSDQGFQYGNYTENGSMPNITFTETHNGGNGLVFGNGTYLYDETNVQKAEIERIQNGDSKYTSLYKFTLDDGVTYHIDGLKVINAANGKVVSTISVTEDANNQNTKSVVIGSKTYTIVQKARCLINISGIYTVCINDAQNESLTKQILADGLFDYAVSYQQSLDTKVYDGSKGNADAVREVTISDNTKSYYSYNVYADSYSNPVNINTRKELTYDAGITTAEEVSGRNALNMACNNVDGQRYSRDVCNYEITNGELTVGKTLIEKQTTFYIYVTNSKRYNYNTATSSYEQNDAGTYVKYGEGLYAIIDENEKYEYSCELDAVTGQLECEYKKNTVDESKNNYLKVVVNKHNYKISDFEEDVIFAVTSADITVTPVEKQNKIYGEADVEIRFTVQTRYVASRTQYQTFANSNIVSICNNVVSPAECFSGDGLNAYKYDSIGASSLGTAGTYIMIPKGWEVTLNSYAYDEENESLKAENLDYGLNRVSYKHKQLKDAGGTLIKTDNPLGQSSTDVKHYDKYTTYKNSITTTRILIGNLYVNEWDQTVGEKEIVNGLKVGLNRLANDTTNPGAKNYNLTYESKMFVVVPRPVNVEIENITKIYGQATDVDSFDNQYMTEKIVGDGILIKDTINANGELSPNEDHNESKLINNYNIIEKDLQLAIGATFDIVSGQLVGLLKTSTYGEGNEVSVLYMKNSTDFSKMNMPHVTSKLFDDDNVYKHYTDVTVSKFYTATGNQERKNNTLNISVQRGESYNISRDNSTCFIDDGMACEDVGEYYLSFAVRGEAQTKKAGIENAYYGKYWGYNNNYYVVVYNNFENSGWSAAESGYQSITADNNIFYNAVISETDRTYTGTYTADTAPAPTATLKIRKRAVQIVVETIKEYTYEASDTGTHIRVGTSEDDYVYHKIMDTNRYNYVNSKFVQSATGNYLCTYAVANTTSNCYEIKTDNRFNIKSNAVGERYAIEQNMDVPALVTINNNKDRHHTTYNSDDYKNITWYDQPLQVRTKDKLVGEVAYCQSNLSLGLSGLDSIRYNTNCDSTLHYYNVDENSNGIMDINEVGQPNFFTTHNNGYYIITREKNRLFIGSEHSGIANGDYEANNYLTEFVNGILQIDIDETAPFINVETDFIIKEANSGTMSKDTIADDVLGFLNNIKNNGCASLTATRTENALGQNIASSCDTGIVFTYEDETLQAAGATVNREYIMTLLEWFGITSFDPSIMRADSAVGKRYDPRWYMAIQFDFDQRKTGDYTLFVYVQDNAGNISLATLLTLRIVDTTKPTVGQMNLYNAKVECKTNTNCSVEDNWYVAEDVYLPINTLSEANLDAMNDADKVNRYAFAGKVGGVATFIQNNYFGTYYKITAGTPAAAVKHTGWTNTDTGIYMTITGGDDNSLTYLNTGIYTKYTVSGTTITVDNANGSDILLGSFVNVQNITKYRRVGLNASGDEVAIGSAASITYLPDKTGTIIKYKGHFYNLRAVDGLSAGYIGAAPTLDDYKLKLYSFKNNVYTEVTTVPESPEAGVSYFIMDGSLYELPSERYDSTGKHSSSGEYVNIAQWNHYYSRDGGNTWALYDRDTINGYLVLGQDGQRLIVIKAIDNGYTFAPTAVDKSHVIEAYCHTTGSMTCQTWNDIAFGNLDIKDASNTVINYKEYVGEKVWKYNISDWEAYSDEGNRDRQYAYLDTIIPYTQLEDQFIEVYEYGCSEIDKCSTNHTELFGTASDGYLYKLDRLVKYNNVGTGVATADGEYVKINGELIKIEETRRFNIDLTTKVITPSPTGSYIYLGKTDAVIDVDSHISKVVNSRINSDIQVYNKYISAASTVGIDVALELTEENAAKLLANTKFLQSGVGQAADLFDGDGNLIGPNLFDGTGNEDKTFGATITGAVVEAPDIADKFVNLFIYAYIGGGISGSEVENHPYFNKAGYYKFVVIKDGSNYKLSSCYSTTSMNEAYWCGSAAVHTNTYGTMKEAVESLLAVYEAKSATDTDNKYIFNGHEVTFTLDYRVFDIAGNASMYVRKGMLLTGFTRTIGADAGAGAPVAAALAIEVPQNADIANVLSNFSIVTTSGKNLRSGERIVQTVYYNGKLVSSRSAYDLSMLSSLDTSVPGAYKIVYTIERKDGLNYVQGNEVELMVTVKPTVADVIESSVDYMSAIILTMGISAIICAAMFVELRKRQQR